MGAIKNKEFSDSKTRICVYIPELEIECYKTIYFKRTKYFSSVFWYPVKKGMVDKSSFSEIHLSSWISFWSVWNKEFPRR